jgi:phosphate-selective porin
MKKIRKQTLISSILLLTLSLSNWHAYAEEEKTCLVDLLVEKEVITKDEVERLSLKPVIPTGNLTEKIKISGRIHAQWDYLSSDSASESSLLLRRVLLGVSADLGKGWEGVIIADFAGNDNHLDTAYISKKLSDSTTAYVGLMTAPYGVEETTSAAKIKRIERSALNRFFVDDLNWGGGVTGLQLEGEIGGFNYVGAITNIRQSNVNEGSTDANENSYAYWGRIGYTIPLENGEFKLGADLAFLPDDAVAQYNSDLTPGSRDALAYNLYSQTKIGGFSLLAQLMSASIDNASANSAGTNNANDANPWGINIMPSYQLSDKLEAVISYSVIDSDGVGVDPSDATRSANDGGRHWDKYQELYLGGNYYIRGNDLKLSFGYVYGKGKDILDGDHGTAKSTTNADIQVDGVRARLQLLF